MKVVLKIAALLLLGFFVWVIFAVLGRQSYHPLFHHREHVNAWVQRNKNPGPETEARYLEVHSRWLRDNGLFEAALAGLLGLNVYAGLRIVRSLRSKKSP